MFKGLNLPSELIHVLTWRTDNLKWSLPGRVKPRSREAWKRRMHELDKEDYYSARWFFYVDPIDPCGPCWVRSPGKIRRYSDLDTAKIAVSLRGD